MEGFSSSDDSYDSVDKEEDDDAKTTSSKAHEGNIRKTSTFSYMDAVVEDPEDVPRGLCFSDSDCN
jgi:hypothetical protein